MCWGVRGQSSGVGPGLGLTYRTLEHVRITGRSRPSNQPPGLGPAFPNLGKSNPLPGLRGDGCNGWLMLMGDVARRGCCAGADSLRVKVMRLIGTAVLDSRQFCGLFTAQHQARR